MTKEDTGDSRGGSKGEKPLSTPGLYDNLMCVCDVSEFERHFVQLEVCSKFPPAPDRDEVALSEDAVEASQRREPKYCKWSKQKLMSITSHTCLTQDDTG